MRHVTGRRTVILLVPVAVLAMLTMAAAQAIQRGLNDAIPQADLLGPTPTPTVSLVPSPSGRPSPSPPPLPGAGIQGPLNILIVGVDTREWIPTWVPHADTVMIMHVNADLSQATLTSLPRDLIVDIPAFAPAGFRGQRSKLTHAMSMGSKVPGGSLPNPVQGFQLVARTVSNYTGIAAFDAGALLTFTGLRKVIDALGGVDLYVDQRVQSIHLQPGGGSRPGCRSCEHGYTGPRATYDVGLQHLVGWQALDYVRQRYIPGVDYARTRHQRQLLKAIVGSALRLDVLANPATAAELVTALGSTLIFDGRGRTPLDFAYALRKLRPATITSVSLPGSSVYGSGGQYLGERLDGAQSTLFPALRQDALAAWLASHPSLVD